MIGDLFIGGGVGVLAGLVFFGGLRWTVAKVVDARQPALLAAASFFVRSAVIVAMFVLMADGRLLRILAGLVGLLVVRTVMVSVVRRDLRAMGE